jgi:hypothetical protein
MKRIFGAKPTLLYNAVQLEKMPIFVIFREVDFYSGKMQQQL